MVGSPLPNAIGPFFALARNFFGLFLGLQFSLRKEGGNVIMRLLVDICRFLLAFLFCFVDNPLGFMFCLAKVVQCLLLCLFDALAFFLYHFCKAVP